MSGNPTAVEAVPRERDDVVIVGAGLAGLSLARQLLLQTDTSVFLLDKWNTPFAGAAKRSRWSLDPSALAGFPPSDSLALASA